MVNRIGVEHCCKLTHLRAQAKTNLSTTTKAQFHQIHQTQIGEQPSKTLHASIYRNALEIAAEIKQHDSSIKSKLRIMRSQITLKLIEGKGRSLAGNACAVTENQLLTQSWQ